VDQFPHLPLSESEVFALLVAHKAIAQYRGTPLEKGESALFAGIKMLVDFSLG